MSIQNNQNKDTEIEDMIRASWFARLALGSYSEAPLMPEKTMARDPQFSQQGIDLCS